MGYRTSKELAEQMSGKRSRDRLAYHDGYDRETFIQSRDEARKTARAFLERWPAAACLSAVESWRELPGGDIEFTMKRLKSAD